MRSKESEQREKWIKQAFWFLVEQYNFKYHGYVEGHSDFASEKVRFRVEPGHQTPYTFIYRVGEPDFTRLVLEGILRHIEGKVPDIDFQAHSLEYNLKAEANILKERAHKIIDEIDDWWLPCQKNLYKELESDYRKSGQMDDFLFSYKKFHDYLKSKGVI
jgi:hypothetical protein